MALLDFDSFDYYQTPELGEVYTAADTAVSIIDPPLLSVRIDTGTGRCGSNALLVQSFPGCFGVRRGLSTSSNIAIFGIAAKIEASAFTTPIMRLTNGAFPIFDLNVGVDGSIYGVNNPDAAFPAPCFTSVGGLVTFGIYTQIGVYLVLASSGGGSVTIAINGTVQQTITGIDTIFSGDPTIPTGVQLGGSQFTTITLFDDFYYCDGDGPAPWNDLLGDVHVQRLRPIGPGALTEFTLTGAPTNWEAEDKGDTPDTSSYISSDTVDITDTYEYEDVTAVAGLEIFGVKESAQSQKTTTGTRTIEFLKRQSGVNYPTGTDLALPVLEWHYQSTVMMNDPQTGSQWSGASAVNGSDGNEFGVKVSS